MKHFNSKTLAIMLAGAMGVSALGASAASFSTGQSLFDKQMQTKSGRKAKNARSFNIKSLEAERDFSAINNRAKLTAKDPDLSFKNLPQWDYLEGPNGENWFYVAEYEYQDVYFNEYYTEHLKRSFKFTIYDEGFNIVGTVQDEIRFSPGDEWEGPKDENGEPTWYPRDVECVLDPQVSRKFFNTDDKLEVMVFHAMNSKSYTNHYYYDVYQIGGAKDKDGNDTPIARMEGRCVETFNYDKGAGENYYYTFVLDPIVDWPLNDPNALEKLHKSFFHLTTYEKATGEEGPKVFFEYNIMNTHVPGDTTDGIYFMTKVNNGVMYLVYSQYEKPCLIDPRGGAIDERQTEDNNLLITLYKTTGDTPVLNSETKIPVEILTSEEHLIYSFYSIGSVAWTDDIDMVVNGTPEAPAFIVSHDVAAAAALDDVLSSYDLYDANGKYIRTIANGMDGITVLSYLKEEQPLAVLLEWTDKGDYLLNFINLYSGEKKTTISGKNNDDPLYADTFSVLKGDDGKYTYVFEMRYLEDDDDYNSISRVAWFNDNGELDHIDKINMGKDIQASQVNIFPECLNPHLYDSDDNMEYAVLVKRTQPNGTTRNEFLVVDDNGERYAKFTKDDGKGDPALFTILPGSTNRLQMVYQDDNFKFNVDLYDLPFLEHIAGINQIENSAFETASPVYFDLQGRQIANPEKGIYLKKTGSKVEKIIK